MLILAIECSGPTGSVAVWQDQRTLCSIVSGVKRTHSEKLMPLVDLVLRQAEVDKGGLSAIAVSIGPGSFTGLRIGVGVAKGLSFALGIPIVPVETLPVIACNAAGIDRPICVVTPSRKDEVFTGLFRWTGEEMGRLEEDRAESPESLVARIDHKTCFLGAGALARRDFLQTVLEDFFVLGEEHQHLPRAEVLASLAYKKMIRGETCPSNDVSPKYVREPTPVVRLQRSKSEPEP